MSVRKGIGGHQSAAAESTTWLTPPSILAALGGWQSFDLDPCAAPAPRPWPTARAMNALADGDGLALEWSGRVWLNGPYGAELSAWLAKMARHGNGTALMFARTETEMFCRHVWERANGLLFLEGRLHFHRPFAPDAERCQSQPHQWEEYAPKAFACRCCGMAKANGGAPSVLAAYGTEDMDRLAACTLPGAFVPLRLARGLLIAGLEPSWAEAVASLMRASGGRVTVSEAYRYFAQHPKARGRAHWRAQVRKVLQRIGERVAPETYQVKAEQRTFAFT